MDSMQKPAYAHRRTSPTLTTRPCMHSLSMAIALFVIALLSATTAAQQDIGKCSRLLCRTKEVWSFGPSPNFLPCKCGPFGATVDEANCPCGPCHRLQGEKVFAFDAVGGVCGTDSLKCDGCYRFYSSNSSSASRGDESGSATLPAPTSSTPTSTTPVSAPSATSSIPSATKPEAQTTSSKSSSSNGILTAIIMIVIGVVLGTVLGVTIWYYRRIKAQGNNPTPREEPNYVVVVQSVSDTPRS